MASRSTTKSPPNHIRKKRKTEDHERPESFLSQQQPVPAKTRHEELWFEDGNVLINSVDGTEFRLHEGLLAYNSDKLKELIVSARSARRWNGVGTETVSLDLEDRAESLASFFSVLYGKSSWLDRRVALEFSTFRVVTLLAVKYRVQHLVDSAVLRLRESFPGTSLQDYEKSSSKEPIRFQNADYIAVIGLAHECNALDILPVAYYSCIDKRTVEQVLDGVQYGGHTVHLSPADLRKLLVGRDKLMQLNGRVTRVVLEASVGQIRGEGCAARETCTASLLSASLRYSLLGFFSRPSCLTSLIGLLAMQMKLFEKEHPVCLSCMAAVQKAEDVRRAEAFAKLGAIFGVQDWPRSTQG